MRSIKEQIEYYRDQLAQTDEQLDLGLIGRSQHREKSWFYVGAIYALETLVKEIDKDRRKLKEHSGMCDNCTC